MGLRYERATATGVANTTVLDDGIESTQAEQKTLQAVWLYVSGEAGNIIELWIEQERVMQISDHFVYTDESAGSTNVQKSTNRMARFEINRPLPVGQRARLGIKCGATAKNLDGCYEYEIAD